MSDTIANIEDALRRRRDNLRKKYDVILEVISPDGTKKSVPLEGLRIVLWKDPEGGGWELEVASLGIADDDDPHMLVVPAQFMDCLTPALEVSKGNYFLRKAFHRHFSEAMIGLGDTGIPPEAVVLVKADVSMAVPFDRWEILRTAGAMMVLDRELVDQGA